MAPKAARSKAGGAAGHLEFRSRRRISPYSGIRRYVTLPMCIGARGPLPGCPAVLSGLDPKGAGRVGLVGKHWRGPLFHFLAHAAHVLAVIVRHNDRGSSFH